MTRGKPSPYCGPDCRDAAGRHREDVRYWTALVARWEGYDPGLLAWCRGGLDVARRLPHAFYLDPTAHWALRASPDEQRLLALAAADRLQHPAHRGRNRP